MKRCRCKPLFFIGRGTQCRGVRIPFTVSTVGELLGRLASFSFLYQEVCGETLKFVQIMALTVFTLSSKTASSSQTKSTFLWRWKADTGYMWFTDFSNAASRARARFDPAKRTTTSLATSRVPTPTERVRVGTSSCGTCHRSASCSLVSAASVLGRVWEVKLDPGSFRATCPNSPKKKKAERSQKISSTISLGTVSLLWNIHSDKGGEMGFERETTRTGAEENVIQASKFRNGCFIAITFSR